MNDLKKISFFFIPYLTICASLFHIAFWDTFSLNGLSFISLTDIIKTSIYPICTIPLTYLYQLLLFNFTVFSDTNNQKKWTQLQILAFFVISKALLELILYLTKQNDEPYAYICYCILFSFFMSSFLTNSKLFETYFENLKFRNTFIQLIVFLPVVTFCAGKFQSVTLKQNSKYRYAITTNNSNLNNISKLDTLKYLGSSDEQYLFSDLKNSKILFIKKDIIDTLTLYEKK